MNKKSRKSYGKLIKIAEQHKLNVDLTGRKRL
jgi:hypothetical protein